MSETLRQQAINVFKAFYSKFDKRIKNASNKRFVVAESGKFIIVKLVYYGKRYVQQYKLSELKA